LDVLLIIENGKLKMENEKKEEQENLLAPLKNGV